MNFVVPDSSRLLTLLCRHELELLGASLLTRLCRQEPAVPAVLVELLAIVKSFEPLGGGLFNGTSAVFSFVRSPCVVGTTLSCLFGRRASNSGAHAP